MASESREITKGEWKSFFDGVSRHYRGRIVDVELIGRQYGVQALAKRVPFIGVTLEDKVPSRTVVEVISGGREDELMTHVIASPEHVWMRQEANGCDNAMAIETGDGSLVIIEFDPSEIST